MSDDLVFTDPDLPAETTPDSAYPFPCDFPGCSGGGKTERGLKSHKTRAHGEWGQNPSDRPKGPKSRQSSLEKELTVFVGTIAVGVSMFDHDGFCGPHIMQSAETVAKAWDHMARENKTVRKVLEMMLQTSAIGEVCMATGLMIIPILAQHGMLPPAMKVLGGLKVPDYPPADAS